MAKLVLKVEDLAVETFHTVSETPVRGTVVAAAPMDSEWTECRDTFYDGGCPTHETACPYESCMVNSQCCPSQEGTCYFSCMPGCTEAPSSYCYQTEVC